MLFDAFQSSYIPYFGLQSLNLDVCVLTVTLCGRITNGEICSCISSL